MATHIPIFPFFPHPFLRSHHTQIMVARFRPRYYLLRTVPQEDRLFQVEAQSHILAVCSWQSNRTLFPTLVLVHGLEGCHESHYMRGLAHKAWHAGFNVVRFNQRNCAGTEHLTPTLYNGGLSQDIQAVIEELTEKDAMQSVWLAGYSMGGNLILKMAGEVGTNLPGVKGLAAICPSINPAACIAALEEPRNWLYHTNFLLKLKARLKRKSRYFPGKWDLSLLRHIHTISQFDDAYTAPDGGYENANEYYERSGARHVLEKICIPTLMITSKDDPFVPYSNFKIGPIENNNFIQLIAPNYGGHCGFIQRANPYEDTHWAENRILEFIQKDWEEKKMHKKSFQ